MDLLLHAPASSLSNLWGRFPRLSDSWHDTFPSADFHVTMCLPTPVFVTPPHARMSRRLPRVSPQSFLVPGFWCGPTNTWRRHVGDVYACMPMSKSACLVRVFGLRCTYLCLVSSLLSNVETTSSRSGGGGGGRRALVGVSLPSCFLYTSVVDSYVSVGTSGLRSAPYARRCRGVGCCLGCISLPLGHSRCRSVSFLRVYLRLLHVRTSWLGIC